MRAFRAVNMAPRFIARADGAYEYDEDGKKYIDYVCSWGPMILGHNHPVIREAVEKAVKDGLSVGAPPRREAARAARVVGRWPHCQGVPVVKPAWAEASHCMGVRPLSRLRCWMISIAWAGVLPCCWRMWS